MLLAVQRAAGAESGVGGPRGKESEQVFLRPARVNIGRELERRKQCITELASQRPWGRVSRGKAVERGLVVR